MSRPTNRCCPYAEIFFSGREGLIFMLNRFEIQISKNFGIFFTDFVLSVFLYFAKSPHP
jgi:hypothetical protein